MAGDDVNSINSSFFKYGAVKGASQCQFLKKKELHFEIQCNITTFVWTRLCNIIVTMTQGVLMLAISQPFQNFL